MAITKIEDLPPLLKKNQRIVGIDFGDKMIGVALSDTRRKIASPFKTIISKRSSVNANEIINLIEEFDVGALIVGMPYHMNGTEGERCQKTKNFIYEFLSLYEFPIVTWDERLSTKAADASMIEGNLSRKKRSKVIDRVAASYVLQGALDCLSLYESFDGV
ncbi:MAG: Holliday junction resolvase RuvX [Alphaproteobacteria bacterium]